ncbi:MAG: hypothetical protein K2J08_13390 [Ruminococcus sp.]|nr:hypothetical protein [Ruminococcus sp.]
MKNIRAKFHLLGLTENFRLNMVLITMLENCPKYFCISSDAIWSEYIPRGFNQFKIESRGAGRLRVIKDYMYYLIRPVYRDEAMFMFLHNLERNGIVKIDNV